MTELKSPCCPGSRVFLSTKQQPQHQSVVARRKDQRNHFVTAMACFWLHTTHLTVIVHNTNIRGCVFDLLSRSSTQWLPPLTIQWQRHTALQHPDQTVFQLLCAFCHLLHHRLSGLKHYRRQPQVIADTAVCAPRAGDWTFCGDFHQQDLHLSIASVCAVPSDIDICQTSDHVLDSACI